MMKRLRAIPVLALAVFFAGACSVISPEIRREAQPQVPFGLLVQEPTRFMGKTVILGGYILETRIRDGETEMAVLQAPLDFQDQPGSRDSSAGRFLVTHQGYLDPEVYRKDRQVTIAGIVKGRTMGSVENCPYPCLMVQSRQIYLWPEYDRYWDRHYYGDFPYFYPFGYRRSFYNRHWIYPYDPWYWYP